MVHLFPNNYAFFFFLLLQIICIQLPKKATEGIFKQDFEHPLGVPTGLKVCIISTKIKQQPTSCKAIWSFE